VLTLGLWNWLNPIRTIKQFLACFKKRAGCRALPSFLRGVVITLGVTPAASWLRGCLAIARVRVVAVAVAISSLAALVAVQLRAGPCLAPAASCRAQCCALPL
jgi:hypothetical protein